MKRFYDRALFLGLAFFLLGNLAAFGESPASDAAAGPLPGARPGAAKAKIAAGDHQVWRESYAKLPLSFEANLGQTDPRVKFLSRGSGYTLFLTNSDAVLTLHGSKVRAEPPGLGAQSSQTRDLAGRPTSVLSMKLAGANSNASAAGADKLPGRINYFIGNDPKNWHTNIPTYSQVQYHDVYPGVDLTYYGNQGQLEYDFAVSPGADPRSIRLQLQGADKVRLSPSGDLILSTRAGEVRLRKPDVYQTDPADAQHPNEPALARHEISGRYVVTHNNEVGFEVGAYDHKQALVIDPVLVYSTYLGGSNDEKLSGVGVTSSGEMLVAGDTASDDFPIVNPYQGTLGSGSPRNVFVTELSADGSSLVFSTYLGGSSSDGGWGVAVDSSGNIYVDGFASSTNFPTTSNAYQQSFVGTGYDIFLSKFDSSGSSLLYSTYIGQLDYALLVDGQVGLAANNSGLAYVCGTTNSSSYPVTPNAAQTTFAGLDDGVVTVLDTTQSGGSSLVYSTFLGGSTPNGAETTILNIALDSSDNVYATGYTKSTNFPTTTGAFQPKCPQTGTCTANAFVSKINPAGGGSSDLVYSSYFGGTDTNVTHGLGIAVDSSGDAYITGFTQAADLPTTPGAFQASCSKCGTSANLYEGFVAAFNPTGTGLIYATYLGGESYDEPKVIAVDSQNDAYIVGRTSSTQFPVLNPLQATKAGPTATTACQSGDCSAFDGFITELNPTGTGLVFSTFNGGSNFDSWNADAVDSSGNLYVGGRTESLDYAATAGAFQPAHAAIAAGSAGLDATMAKISPANAPGVGLGPASIPACTANVNPPCFGSQAVGTTSAAQAIILTAAGSASLTISSIVVTGPFAETDNCITTLAAGAQCTINVTFSPIATGSQTGTLTINDNATPSSQNVPLTGMGTAATGPVASFSPTSLTFASQIQGTPSAAQVVTLTNVGVGTLDITSISITGTNPGDFSQTNNCGTTVAQGANCTINVTFTPAATGTRTASLSVADNGPGSPQTVALTGTGTFVQLNPTSLTFASQILGTTSAPQTVTLTNASTTAALSITSISISGANPGDFAQTNNCGSSVAASASCTINVTFTPTAAGTRAAAVTIADSDGSSPQTVPLTGTGTTSVSLSPTSLTFAAQSVGTTSAAQPVTLTNTGGTSLSITSITLTGTDPGDFAQTNNCGTSVSAGMSCTINVTFTPTATGTRTASLSVADSAVGSPQTVSLTGSGGTPAVSLSPTSLTFTTQAVGTTSTAQVVTLTNTGSAALSITSVTITGADSGDFKQTNTCGTSVASGANCTISVTFTPAANGTRTASVSIADNAAGSPQTVSLTGTGGTPAVSLSPTSLTFVSQTVGSPSPAQSVTLTNTGTAALSVTSITVTGTNPGDFAQTNTCGTSVAAGANCTISVTFTPAATGTRSASISIADNATGSPQTVSLTGTGAAAGTPAVSLSPTSLTFPLQVVGQSGTAQVVTLTNTGTGALSITSISVTGTYSRDYTQTNTCGTSVAAGANCTISVTFKPHQSSPPVSTATLSITDNATGSPQTVGLSGTGTFVQLVPTSLTFGSQAVGTTSAAQTVTLTNTLATQALTLAVTIAGTNPGDFQQTNNCGTSVAALASCTFNVTFTPTALGIRTASISIADNGGGSPQTVALTGGSGPAVTLAPTSLTFASQTVGTPSTSQPVTLTNSGTSALSITSISITGTNSGDFAQTNTCGTSVAAAASCTISVTFTPTAAGTRTASISIADNAGGSPQSVALTGTGAAPAVTLAPASLTFSSQTVGTPSASQPVTLTNSGTAALSITSISITGTDPGDFAQTNNCGTSVAAGATCTISVTFTPTAAGTRTASVSIADNATGSPQSVTLTGTGTSAPAPAVTLAPTTLTFTGQAVGTTSAAQLVTLTNGGSSTLSITSVSITGANPGDFAQTNTCGTSVAAGASCAISVTFTPAALGIRTASVSIADNAPGSPQTVALAGTTGPVASLSPPTGLTFPQTNVGSSSAAQTVTLSNIGTSTLTLTSIALTGTNSGDFTYTSTCGSNTLQPGASCTLMVTFKPTATGIRSASVTITDNAPGSPQSVALSGTGITTPGASLSPGSLAFSTTQSVGTTSPSQNVTLTNTGSAILSNISVSTTSGFGETTTCGATLAAGASCTISVYFKPAAGGALTGSLTVVDNAPDSPQAVALTGTAVASGVGFQPTNLAFKGQPLNTPSAPQTVTLTNTGTAALSISSIAFTGSDAADFSQTNNCPSSSATLSAGGTCTISVVFNPTTSGNLSAALTVTDNAPGSPHSLGVSGAGSGFELTAPTSTATVTAGQPASYALSFAATGGFSGMVTLSCTTTAPAASCSVAPATLTLNAPNTATATATVTTTANGAAPPRRQLPSGPGPWLWWALAGAMAVGLGLLGRSAQRTRWVLAGALVVVLAWAGCGGGSSSTSTGPTSTPAGKYQVTVTANAATVSQNVTLTLTVQ